MLTFSDIGIIIQFISTFLKRDDIMSVIAFIHLDFSLLYKTHTHTQNNNTHTHTHT